MDKNKLEALISLLEDPDEKVFDHVQEQLLSLGQDVIPALENAWEHSFDPKMQERIEEIIHSIQFDITCNDLIKWKTSKEQDLLEGALMIARYQYPDVDAEKIKKLLEQMKQDIWLELNENLTALEKVRIINHIIFDVHGFSGNTTNFHAPQNSYINNVVESKKGNPLSLAILYMIVAKELNIPIYGINLPEHFVLAYRDEYSEEESKQEGIEDQILFYVNPFSRGTVFGKKEILAFLKQLKLEAKEGYFKPCNHVDILERLLNNLIISYEKLGYPNKVEELQRLRIALLDG